MHLLPARYRVGTYIRPLERAQMGNVSLENVDSPKNVLQEKRSASK